MKYIYLVRHPETDWNRQGRFQGRSERPLTRCGVSRAGAVSAYLRDKGPDTVVSSPTHQARRLARKIFPRRRRGVDIVADDSWCEIDHGAWEGLTYPEVLRRFGPAARTRFGDPLHYRGHGGETLAEADTRVGHAFALLLEAAGRVTVVVTHATPIRLVLCRCLDDSIDDPWRFRIDHCGVTRIRHDRGSSHVDFVNRLPPP